MISKQILVRETIEEGILSKLNKEKQDIIKTDGNVLVVANPGTGKTKLLAFKYIHLVNQGVDPNEILCLTFTEKAKREIEERIITLLQEYKPDFDFSKLRVHTFHSYSLEYLDDFNVVSNNLLRYSIFKFLKDNEVLNYGDSYLIETIVPKMENLIRYLKSFGILPVDIDLKKVKSLLKEDEDNKFTKDEIDRFADYFVKIYAHYEIIKNEVGIDYSDMLNNFMHLKKVKKFEYVLIDELQDVNKIEAEIALRSANNFIAVGDKKQAIFGFQGGSILNFDKFKKAKQFVLGENFRSSNEILDYAKNFFIERTADESHKEDLAPLKNANGLSLEKPVIYGLEKEKIYAAASELAKKLSENGESVAIITRTNYQIIEVSRELQNKGIDHSTTYFSASVEAKNNIITFLKGIFSKDPQYVKNALFTPFSPIPLQEAFELSDQYDLTLDQLLKKCPEVKKLRESVKNVEDVNLLFEKVIIPVAVSYGKEYLLASLNVQESSREAVESLKNKSFKDFIAYLQSSDLMANESDTKKRVIVTTVHKSKGLEFDNVIYIPSKQRDRSNFQDIIVEAILKTHNINAKEELNEEALRVDFVAFTRAIKKLFILSNKPADYLTEYSNSEELSIESVETFNFAERAKRAYCLFALRDYDKAKALLEINKCWLISLIKAHFDSLDRISFSSAKDDPFEYLLYSILNLREPKTELDLGTKVHSYAEALINKEQIEKDEDVESFIDNIKYIIKSVNQDYPEVYGTEHQIIIPLSKLVKTDCNLMFKGKIDAIFKNSNGEYLILDWKTDKDEKNASKHRQQLETYKRAFSIREGISLDKINVAIGYIGLRGKINMGKTNLSYDDKVPAKSAFETFSKRLNTLLSWQKDVNLFFNDLNKLKISDDPLWRAIVEQYNYEVENAKTTKKYKEMI